METEVGEMRRHLGRTSILLKMKLRFGLVLIFVKKTSESLPVLY